MFKALGRKLRKISSSSPQQKRVWVIVGVMGAFFIIIGAWALVGGSAWMHPQQEQSQKASETSTKFAEFKEVVSQLWGVTKEGLQISASSSEQEIEKQTP